MTPRLAARGLKRSFRIGGSAIEVLRGIDLDVHAGEIVFLAGASGAGKTTLLYTLAGLETPESGTVEFEGLSLYKLPGGALARLRNERMGFVFQSYFLLPELTARENVLLPAMIKGADANRLAAELLEKVGLAGRMDHLPAELSGGEQQRVAIARSLVNDPAILFADEPTGNLDSKNGEAIISLLLDLAKSGGRTLVVVTHDENLARRGDRLVRIVDGRLADS
jgi:putative ABC transport system ATP-binding protein/lipoprotein-releasing system ATP-binding protein